MSALNIKKGSSSHSAYDLRDPNAPVNETHTLAVLVDNESGVLARVIGLFSGRGYNIESLTVAEVEPSGPPLAHHRGDDGHAAGDRPDQGAARPHGAGARGP